MLWMAFSSGSRPYHHHCFGRGAVSSAESIETVFGKHSLSRFSPTAGRVFHTAKSALRLWPLVGVTASALHLQSKGRWQQNPLFCRSSASEAAGPLPLAVEVPQMPHDGGSGGQPDQSSTQPGLTGAPQTTDQAGHSNLRLLVAAFMIPHPDKVDRGGEDAYFVGDNGLSLGVADGVGGWADMGVDPGEYARQLMQNAKEAAERTPPSKAAPVLILTSAWERTIAQGSATACIIVLDGEYLQAANLGDSGFLVIRDNKSIFRSPSQQHDFNFPFQLGTAGTQSDRPEDAEVFSVKVQKGDIVVLGSDGLFDNVFPEESAAIASLIHARGDPPQVAAAGLAQFASIRANDPLHTSPFAFLAQTYGHRYNGGKLDDITVLVGYVTPEAAPTSKL